MAYTELQVTSNYSFLRGASDVEELFAQAAAFGFTALALTDRNSLAGIVRAHQRATQAGLRLIVGCRLDLRDGTALLVYPTDRPAYSRLCHLLSVGKKRAGKGACDLGWEDVAAYAEGLLAILIPGEPDEVTAARLSRVRGLFPGRAYLALTLRRRPGDAVRLRRLADQAAAAGVPAVATGDVLYHTPDRRILQEVVTCIRHGWVPAGAQRRPPFAVAWGKRPPVRHLPGRRRPHAGDCGEMPLLAQRTALPIPERIGPSGGDGTAGAGTPSLGGRPEPLSGGPAG
jgi:error-prone DNA polymerase